MIATLSLGSSLLCLLLISANGELSKESIDYLRFPPDFLLGAATAAYQVEGAWNVSDKGESIWDRFSHFYDGRIVNNDDGDIAANSYYLYKEDVALLKKLGFKTYRFSVSWPRILPTGFSNKVSEDGVRYYHDLIDELLANDIEPIMTLYHWDHPQVMEDAGGWLNSEMVEWFGDFSRVVYREFASKVKRFIPINEPTSICVNGYSTGEHAPGKKFHGFGEYYCIHNVIKAHARAYRIYEKEFKKEFNGEVGFQINLSGYFSKNPDDELSHETAYQFNAGWTMHPIFTKEGDYPELMKDMVAAKSRQQGYSRSRLPEFGPEWVDYIRGASDFLAVNHYTSRVVAPGVQGSVPSHDNDEGLQETVNSNWTASASSWLKIVPEGFREILRELAQRYGNPPMYITENGVSDHGTLNDNTRIDYYREYLKQMLLAMYVDGVNVQRYYLWSLIDNFEWQRGYSERFGIVYVDYSDPKRSRKLKDSANWWQRVNTDRKIQ